MVRINLIVRHTLVNKALLTVYYTDACLHRPLDAQQFTCNAHVTKFIVHTVRTQIPIVLHAGPLSSFTLMILPLLNFVVLKSGTIVLYTAHVNMRLERLKLVRVGKLHVEVLTVIIYRK